MMIVILTSGCICKTLHWVKHQIPSGWSNSICCSVYPPLKSLASVKVTDIPDAGWVDCCNCFQFLRALVCHEKFWFPLWIPRFQNLKPLFNHLSNLILRYDCCSHSPNAQARFDHEKETWKTIICGFVYGIHACDGVAVFDEPLLLLRGLKN